MKTKIEKGVVIVAVVLVLGLIARTFLLNNAKKPSEPEDETSVTGTVTPTRTAAPTDATATVTGQPDKTPTESAGPTEEPLPTATPTPHSLQEREVTPTLTPVPIIETPTPVPTEEPFATPMIPTPTMTEREKDDARYEQELAWYNSLLADGYEPKNSKTSFWYFVKETKTPDLSAGQIQYRTEYVLSLDRHLVLFDDYYTAGEKEEYTLHEIRLSSTGNDKDAELLWSDTGTVWLRDEDTIFLNTKVNDAETVLFAEADSGKFLEEMMTKPSVDNYTLARTELPDGISYLCLSLVVDFTDQSGLVNDPEYAYRYMQYRLCLNADPFRPVETSKLLLTLAEGEHVVYNDGRALDYTLRKGDGNGEADNGTD